MTSFIIDRDVAIISRSPLKAPTVSVVRGDVMSREGDNKHKESA